MGNLQRCNSGNSSICFNTRDAPFPHRLPRRFNDDKYCKLRFSTLCSLSLSLGVNKRGGDKGGIESKVIRDEAV